MNRFRVSFFGAVLFLVVATTSVLMTSHKSAAQNPNAGPDVHIVSPLPLPVTGTLSFANGSAVTVNNPASSPVLVRDVDRGTPFQKTANSLESPFEVRFGAPAAGQRWIVEHVSGTVSVSPFQNQTLDVFYFTLGIGFGTQPGDTLIPQKTTPFLTVTNSQTKFVVNAGEQLVLSFNGEFTAGATPSLHAFIAGVIVPAP
jgi:hypothetical protein